jgi:hypothetical protein
MSDSQPLTQDQVKSVLVRACLFPPAFSLFMMTMTAFLTGDWLQDKLSNTSSSYTLIAEAISLLFQLVCEYETMRVVVRHTHARTRTNAYTRTHKRALTNTRTTHARTHMSTG